ncbi:MAG TPA: energy-coupling factor transporter ATPase [Candidatus Limnocylindria bacterium]|nr:energy-coupling factor transporter ATPase [Candidatus Limnocylindria bacterium]
MPIVLEKVTYVYRSGPLSNQALEDVSLTIGDGEIVALIGHTGSGKSTLAQHLNGLLAPNSGRVLVDGRDVNEKDAGRKALRLSVGLVFQYPEHQLFEETVFKDVAFGPRNMGLGEEEIDARVREAMQTVGLDPEEVGPRSPFELSGGQMRRVALAGVLAMKPRVLVLDEPTAGLDPRGRDFLLGDLKKLNDAGTTIVLISHSMDDVVRLARRVVVLERGRVVMDGTPREVFSQGERLAAMGLDVPQAFRLARILREGGVALGDAMTMEELADALAAAVKGDGDAA